MDEINETGDRVTATKHGQPVATVGPAHRKTGSLWGFMEGTPARSTRLARRGVRPVPSRFLQWCGM